jgi:hypothetical protein
LDAQSAHHRKGSCNALQRFATSNAWIIKILLKMARYDRAAWQKDVRDKARLQSYY